MADKVKEAEVIEPKRGRVLKEYIPFFMHKVKAERAKIYLGVITGIIFCFPVEWRRQRQTGRSIVELYYPEEAVDPSHWLYTVNIWIRKRPFWMKSPLPYTIS